MSAALRKIYANGYIHVIGIIQIAFLHHKFMCLQTFLLFNLVPVDLHAKFHNQSTGKKKFVYLGLIHKDLSNTKQSLLKEN